jgi:hypothetical protein
MCQRQRANININFDVGLSPKIPMLYLGSNQGGARWHGISQYPRTTREPRDQFEPLVAEVIVLEPLRWKMFTIFRDNWKIFVKSSKHSEKSTAGGRTTGTEKRHGQSEDLN